MPSGLGQLPRRPAPARSGRRHREPHPGRPVPEGRV